MSKVYQWMPYFQPKVLAQEKFSSHEQLVYPDSLCSRFQELFVSFWGRNITDSRRKLRSTNCFTITMKRFTLKTALIRSFPVFPRPCTKHADQLCHVCLMNNTHDCQSTVKIQSSRFVAWFMLLSAQQLGWDRRSCIYLFGFGDGHIYSLPGSKC